MVLHEVILASLTNSFHLSPKLLYESSVMGNYLRYFCDANPRRQPNTFPFFQYSFFQLNYLSPDLFSYLFLLLSFLPPFFFFCFHKNSIPSHHFQIFHLIFLKSFLQYSHRRQNPSPPTLLTLSVTF